MSTTNRVRRLVGPTIFAVLVGADMLLNGLLGGSFDETVSERLGRAQRNGSIVATIACAALELIEDNHCAVVLEPAR